VNSWKFISFSVRSLLMLAWVAWAGLLMAALVIGPLNQTVPAWLYQCAWLAGAFAVFTLICHFESSSG
jgi:hypothetical protein